MSEPFLEASKSFLVGALYLGLTGVGWRRAHQRGLARSLTVVCATLFVYHLAEGMSELTGSQTWDRLEFALAPAIAIGTMDLMGSVLVRRAGFERARPFLVAYFSALGVLTAVGLLDPTDPTVPSGARTYGVAMVAVLLPVSSWLLGRLTRQTARRRGPERLEGQLTILACFIGIGGAATDLLRLAGLPVARLSLPSMAVAAVLLALLAFRRRMIPSGRLVALNILVVSMAAMALQAVVLSALGVRAGPVVLVSLFIGLFLFSGLRPALIQQSRIEARRRYLTTIGRFTAQMAHDLRNPIASIEALSQFTLDQIARGQPADQLVEDLECILREASHMEQILATYQRMGRLELHPVEQDLRVPLSSVIRGVRRWTCPQPIDVEMSLDDRPLLATVDEPLFRAAVENLLRNAWEALQGRGGTIRLTASAPRDGGLEIRVEDDGPGMNAETLDLATEDFFSTKGASGGMGLAMVRRVVEAHGGHLTLESEEGRGTRALLVLPSPSAEAEPQTEPRSLRPATSPLRPSEDRACPPSPLARSEER